VDLVNEPILFKKIPHVCSLHLQLFCELVDKKLLQKTSCEHDVKVVCKVAQTDGDNQIELQDETAPKENNRK
jgi:hypothetical protein